MFPVKRQGNVEAYIYFSTHSKTEPKPARLYPGQTPKPPTVRLHLFIFLILGGTCL